MKLNELPGWDTWSIEMSEYLALHAGCYHGQLEAVALTMANSLPDDKVFAQSDEIIYPLQPLNLELVEVNNGFATLHRRPDTLVVPVTDIFPLRYMSALDAAWEIVQLPIFEYDITPEGGIVGRITTRFFDKTIESSDITLAVPAPRWQREQSAGLN